MSLRAFEMRVYLLSLVGWKSSGLDSFVVRCRKRLTSNPMRSSTPYSICLK